MTEKSCIVIGGSSQAASWIVPQLIDGGWTVHLVSRGKKPTIDYGPAATWHHFDVHSEPPPVTLRGRVVFSTLGNVSYWLADAKSLGVERVISFSSTSVLTKQTSDDPDDARMIREVLGKEQAFINTCDRQEIKWTILRPTLIYGGKHGDRTVEDISRMIRRFGFFPIFGGGTGLRQPVHAADLADACLKACNKPATFGKIYSIGGGEILPYREMVERIFAAMGRKPLIVPVPLFAFDLAAAAMRTIPRYRHIRSSMAARMVKDMVFSNDAAATDFGYNPRKFRTSPDPLGTPVPISAIR